MTGGLQGAHALQPVTKQAPRLVPKGDPTVATALTQPCKGQRIRIAPCNPVRRLLMRTPAGRARFPNVQPTRVPCHPKFGHGIVRRHGRVLAGQRASPNSSLRARACLIETLQLIPAAKPATFLCIVRAIRFWSTGNLAGHQRPTLTVRRRGRIACTAAQLSSSIFCISHLSTERPGGRPKEQKSLLGRCLRPCIPANAGPLRRGPHVS
jgi:hypothetical protein